jgi:hypothetical protein
MNLQSIPDLDRQGLCRFGLTTGTIVAALFGLVFPWLFDRQWPLWPWILAAGLAAVALVWPNALRGVYHGWMRIGHALGWLNTRIILGVMFYVMILPAGLIMRILGRDPMARGFSEAESYRVPSCKTTKERFERPF